MLADKVQEQSGVFDRVEEVGDGPGPLKCEHLCIVVICVYLACVCVLCLMVCMF